MKTLICCADVSDTLRIDEAIASLPESERADAVVLCLDRQVEYELEEKKGIPFHSLTKYYRASSDPFVEAAEWTERLFYKKPVMSFDHLGADFSEVFTYSFRHYIERVLYFTDVFASLAEALPEVSKFILFSERPEFLPTTPFAEGRESEAYFDAARAVTAARSREVIVLRKSRLPRRTWFTLKRSAYQLFLIAWNVGMSLVRFPQRPRLLASDYWRNIAPALGSLGAGELVLLDREQFFNIPWRMLYKLRARFVHIEQFESAALRARAKEVGEQFSSRLAESAPTFSEFSFRSVPLDVPLREAFQGILAAVPAAILKFEASVRMLRRFKTECLLLRASASRQTHFSILALAARTIGIPSLELQHGLEYTGPGSLSGRRSAEYVGIYGPLMKREFVALGYTPSRLLEAGSPRFDAHRASPEDSSEFRIVCIVPDVVTSLSSYAMEKYLQTVAHACSGVPRAHVVLKMRPGKGREAFVRAVIMRAFGDIPHTIAQYEPLERVLAGASATISPFSTSLVESMLCGVPTVAYAVDPADILMLSFHLGVYEQAGALTVATDEAALGKALADLAASPEARRKMVSSAKQFLADEFLFDGKASQRIADFIREKTN